MFIPGSGVNLKFMPLLFQAISTLNSSIQFIENLSKNSRNKSAKSRYMKAVLETRYESLSLFSFSL